MYLINSTLFIKTYSREWYDNLQKNNRHEWLWLSSEADSSSIRRDSILDQDSTWHGKNFETTKASREIELGPEGLRLIDIDVQCMSALIISNSDIDGTSEKIKINSNGYKDYGYNIDHWIKNYIYLH